MGLFRKAFTWGRKKPDIAEIVSQLRVLSKQLERERNKLEREARDTKARAVRARKSGQMDAYRMYATEMVRLRRYALTVDKSRLRLLRIISHINQAQTGAKIGIAMERVADILGLLGEATDAKKMVENLDEISRRLEEFEVESGIMEEALETTTDSRVTSEDLAAAMAEIDAEAGMAEAPATRVAASESEKLEDEIRSLEEELGM
ncbi:MAG: Snf7 family protein [Candidatus Thorarchaeota archaeon]